MTPGPWFQISLAQWSLHRALRDGTLDPLDFPAAARVTHGIDAIEYVNSFYRAQPNEAFVPALRQRTGDHGVRNLLIMVDGEGALGAPDEAARVRAVNAHHRWVDAAAALGCHSIRVNAQSAGTPAEQRDRAADGLRRLVEYAAPSQINVIVENHGGLSSNGAWLASVLTQVDHPRCGSLPDFGNFRIDADTEYDRYRGVRELMPFAKAVSAKSHAFDADGNETRTDYRRMMTIVRDAGYRGYVGVEYEGSGLSETDGIRVTKELLERVRAELTPVSSP
ncbi:MAG: sugar phosphate isomerase/epimerase [Phycisphaerae bacterium]|nr:sugar phosphate isomerase/epimerase [Phycisphaerae bacterium]